MPLDPLLVPGAHYALLQLMPTGESAPEMVAASPKGPITLKGCVIATQPEALKASNFQVPSEQDLLVIKEVPVVQPDHDDSEAGAP